MKTYLGLGSGFAIGLVAAHGCYVERLDTLHCANNEGDDYCRGQQFDDGVARSFCQRGISDCYTADSKYGCVAERPADACYSPCGGRSTIDENGECVMVEDSSTGTSTGATDTEPTTGNPTEPTSESSSSTTGPMPCVSDEECTNPEAPFCGMNGECGTCEGTKDPDGACAGVDAQLPLCVGQACVACTPENTMVCDEQLLLCDGESNTCVPCVEHAECGSGACELDVGTCFPEDLVVHVDGDGGQDYESIAEAVGAVPVGMHGVIVVHELDGGDDYGPVLIDGGKRIALLAAPGEAPIIQGTGMNPGVSVQGVGTVLYMDGLRVAGNTMGLGLRVNEGLAWLDRSRIVQNMGGGIVAEGGAELVVRNCFVGRNGDEFADTRGITATAATLDILYTTVAANDGSGTSGPISMSCDAASTGTVRNSIVAAGDDTIDCMNVSFSFNVVDTSGLMGSENDVLSFNPAWFPNIAMADFHIGMGPPFANVAQWTTGDPLTDIDDDPRPDVDGTPDYAGADVP